MIAKKYATTPTIAMFVIVSLTGVLLFFHIGSGNSKMIHEWLGLAFIVFGLLHVFANWTLFKKYLGGSKGIILALLILLPSLYLLQGAESKSGSPIRGAFMKVIKSPLATVAPLYQLSSQEAQQRLRSAGLSVEDPQASLSQIANANGKKVTDVLSLLAATTPQNH